MVETAQQRLRTTTHLGRNHDPHRLRTPPAQKRHLVFGRVLRGWGRDNTGVSATNLQISQGTISSLIPDNRLQLYTTDGSQPDRGDSGAGIIVNGVICGELTTDVPQTPGTGGYIGIRTGPIASWITTTTGIPPGGVCFLDQTKKKKSGRLKVMTMGGELTRGAPNDIAGSYRKYLKIGLDKIKLTVDFVGSKKHGSAPYDSWEGVDTGPGAGRTHDTEEQAKCTIPALPTAPDIITLELGEEDIQEGLVAGAPLRIDSLISTIQKISPRTTVLVSALPAPPSELPAEIPYLEDFNTAVKLMVLARKSAGQHVDFVDESSMTKDDAFFLSGPGIHYLGGDGAEKMSNNFSVAIENASNAGWIYPYPSVADNSLCNGGIGSGGGKPALRLLPLGDSITWGTQSSTGNGYRGPLRSALVNDGFSADFVGERTSGTMYDNYNDGFPGYTIEAVDAFVGSPVGKFLPNVITLMLGTNNMVFNVDPTNAPTNLSKLIDDIYKSDPGVTVLVATLVPSLDPKVQALIPAYNQALPGVVQNQVNQGRHVALVDMSMVNTGDINTGDLTHPTDGGYQKIADAFHAAIQNAVSAGWIGTPVNCSTSGAGCSDPSIKAGSEPSGTDPNAQQTGGGTGTGTRTNAKLRLADFDGDGKADYIYMADDGAMTVWFNQGGGNWSPPKVVALGVASGYQVQLADFNGDGKVDYIVVHDDGTVSVLLNKDGAGNWDDLGQVAFGEGPASEVRFADMDGDGKADYMIVGPGGSIDYWQNRGGDNRGGWGPDLHIALGTAPSSEIQLVDFDGDGKADYVVVAPDGSTQVWINQTGTNLPGGDWKWLHQVANGVGFDGGHVIMADFDGDGRADYFGVGPGGALGVWLNNGGDNQSITGWSDLGTIAYGVGAPVSQIQFAKIDSDKYADYLVVYPKTGAMDAYISHGPQPRGTPWEWDKNANYAFGVPEFFPGDAIRFGTMTNKVNHAPADYIVLHRNSVTDTILYFYLSGDATSSGWSDSTHYADLPLSQSSGDFTPTFTDMTGDGKDDLVYLYKSGAVDGYMNQDAFSNIPLSGKPTTDHTSDWGPRMAIATGVGSDGNHVVFGDFDGDHKSDYLTLSDDGRTVTFYRNLSGGGKWTWGSPAQIAGKVNCKVPKVNSAPGNSPDDVDPKILLADVTGNNKADFLCVHPDGSVQAWQYLDGTQAAPANGWNGIGKMANGYLIPGLQ